MTHGNAVVKFTPEGQFLLQIGDVVETNGSADTTPRFVHGVNVSRDGLVYASDRSHSMLHVHRKDGTYVTEAKLPGPFNSVAFSPDPEQHYLYAGGMNATARIFILRRSDLQMLGSFRSSGQHYMDTDSQGNLYTCGQRMPQRWTLKGLP